MGNRQFVFVIAIVAIGLLLAIAAIPFALYYGHYLNANLKTRSLRERTYQVVVRPTCRWVDDFRTTQGRLPSREEVRDFASTNSPYFGVILFDTKPKWDEIKDHQWRSGIDFMICVPVDDWNLYRNSWDKKEWKAWTD